MPSANPLPALRRLASCARLSLSRIARRLVGATFALALAFGLVVPVAALDLTNLTEAERAALHAEFRDFLLANPEVLIEMLEVLDAREEADRAQADANLVARNADAIFKAPHSWVGGNPDGDVVLVQFIDYSCPYCRQSHPEILALLEFDGNIRLVIKEFPILGPDSERAARFALAVRAVAGDAAYGEIHSRLMTWREGFATDALARLAGQAGLDFVAISARMNSPEITRILVENHALASQLQITGTPGFVIGQRIVRGYVPLPSLFTLVDNARALN